MKTDEARKRLAELNKWAEELAYDELNSLCCLALNYIDVLHLQITDLELKIKDLELAN